jgi:UDP-glucose-4-epimerase GalE
MRVVVTGGAGYIGAHVARGLVEGGHHPIIVDDLRCATADRVGDFVHEPVACEDTPALAEVFRRHTPDAVVHLAGYISVGESVRHPAKYWENNLGAAASLLLACAKHPVSVVLFSSTAAVYGDAAVTPIPERVPLAPTSPYGASKLGFEHLLHASAAALGFRSAALRYFNAAGAHPDWHVGEAHDPEEHLIPRVIAALLGGRGVQVYGNDYPTPDGTCIRDYIHVTDLAAAHRQVLEATQLESGASLNVGTGSGTSVLEVIRAVGARLGRAPDIEMLPRRPGDPASLVADPSALRAALGWRPEHSRIEEIVDSAVEWEHWRRRRA